MSCCAETVEDDNCLWKEMEKWKTISWLFVRTAFDSVACRIRANECRFLLENQTKEGRERIFLKEPNP